MLQTKKTNQHISVERPYKKTKKKNFPDLNTIVFRPELCKNWGGIRFNLSVIKQFILPFFLLKLALSKKVLFEIFTRFS